MRAARRRRCSASYSVPLMCSFSAGGWVAGAGGDLHADVRGLDQAAHTVRQDLLEQVDELAGGLHRSVRGHGEDQHLARVDDQALDGLDGGRWVGYGVAGHAAASWRRIGMTAASS